MLSFISAQGTAPETVALIGPIIGGLINAGGLGLLSAALLWLHREALATFQKELKESRELFQETTTAERRQCSDQFSKILEIAERNHEATMSAINQVGRVVDLHLIGVNSNRGVK